MRGRPALLFPILMVAEYKMVHRRNHIGLQHHRDVCGFGPYRYHEGVGGGGAVTVTPPDLMAVVV